MNLSNLIKWCTGIVLGLAAVRNIDDIQRNVLKAQAILLYESRTETWGSPRFLQTLERKAISRSDDSTDTRK